MVLDETSNQYDITVDNEIIDIVIENDENCITVDNTDKELLVR